MENMPDWVRSYPGAVTVSDSQHRIVYMNDKAAANFEADGGKKLIGSSLMACHNERSKAIIDRLLAEGGINVYTIEKKGQKKLIHQSAWRDATGAVAGLIELSLVLPADLPHFVRG